MSDSSMNETEDKTNVQESAIEFRQSEDTAHVNGRTPRDAGRVTRSTST